MEYRYPLCSKRVRCRCKDARVRQYFMEPALAEKLETVVTRGIANTRGRDYYDIHILVRLKSEEVDRQPLHEAVVATTSSEARSRRWLATQRHSRRSEYRESCEAWTSYIVGSPYAAGPDFDETVGSTFESCSSS